MGGVGGKLPLMLKGGFQALKHFIEGISQLTDLALGPFCGNTGGQISSGSDGLCRLPDFLDGKKGPPGNGVAHQKRHSDQKGADNQQYQEHGPFYGKQGF